MTDRPAEIWIDRGRYGGEPCLYGTRLPVMLLMDYAKHDSDEAVMAAYPQVTAEDLAACRAFLTKWVRRDRIANEPVVECDPQHRFGAPRIKGISTSTVAGLIWTGASVDEVCRDYPLTRPDVLVAVWYEGWYGERWNRRHFGPWAAEVGPALARAQPDYDNVPDPPSSDDVGPQS